MRTGGARGADGDLAASLRRACLSADTAPLPGGRLQTSGACQAKLRIRADAPPALHCNALWVPRRRRLIAFCDRRAAEMARHGVIYASGALTAECGPCEWLFFSCKLLSQHQEERSATLRHCLGFLPVLV